MKTLLFVVIASVGLSSSLCCANEIALTFDDAPRASSYFSGDIRTQKLIDALRSAQGQQVAFFCTTEKFDSAGQRRIQKYAEAGHLIANHSHTHLSLNKVGAGPFIQDITTADTILRSWLNFRPWFRFPFLHEGSSVQDRDAVRSKLFQMGYTNGYITIDNYDWFIDALFQEAVKKKQKIHFDKLEEIYVQTLWDGIQFYDGIAKTVLGRSPKHILLLHENDIAAMFVGALAEKIKTEGWKIISPELAYTDPIAGENPDTLRNNQGRIVSIALARGYKGPTVHESENEDFLRQLSKERKVFE